MQANNCSGLLQSAGEVAKNTTAADTSVRLPHPSVGEGISRLSGKVKKIFSFDNGGDD